jgi:esterase/lipase superfamily enzyme
MKSPKNTSFSKAIAGLFSIILMGLLFSSVSLFGQATTVVAAQSPNPAASATPTPIPAPDNLIVPDGIKVVTNRLNLRQGPGLNYGVMNVLKFGAVLTITGVSTDVQWINVITSDGQPGWVFNWYKYISLAPSLLEQPLLPPILVESRSVGEDEFGQIKFVWQWSGQLAEDQGFEVGIAHEGNKPLGVHNAVLDKSSGNIKKEGDDTYSLTVDISKTAGFTGPSNDYVWTVRIVQIRPNYRELGVEAEPIPLIAPEAAFALAAAPTPNMVRVYYGTNRHLTPANPFDRYDAQKSSLTYGIAEVNIPQDSRLDTLDTSVFTIHVTDPKKFQLTYMKSQNDQAFFTALRSQINATDKKQAFVFVHGFNVNFDDAVRQTAQLAYDLQFDGAPILFSWPANNWPTTDLYPGYWTDQEKADDSILDLKTFLLAIAQRSGAQTIHIIAHSMGNQVLTNALESMGTTPPVFGDIVMAAPDVDTRRFLQRYGPQLIGADHKVTLYASSRDLALLASSILHYGFRAGYIFLKNPAILEDMDTIDATDVGTALLGHSYYADSCSILSDMYSLFNLERSASERTNLRSATSLSGTYWTVPRGDSCNIIQ